MTQLKTQPPIIRTTAEELGEDLHRLCYRAKLDGLLKVDVLVMLAQVTAYIVERSWEKKSKFGELCDAQEIIELEDFVSFAAESFMKRSISAAEEELKNRVESTEPRT